MLHTFCSRRTRWCNCLFLYTSKLMAPARTAMMKAKTEMMMTMTWLFVVPSSGMLWRQRTHGADREFSWRTCDPLIPQMFRWVYNLMHVEYMQIF